MTHLNVAKLTQKQFSQLYKDIDPHTHNHIKPAVTCHITQKKMAYKAKLKDDGENPRHTVRCKKNTFCNCNYGVITK